MKLNQCVEYNDKLTTISENEGKHSQPNEDVSDRYHQKYDWRPSVEKTDVMRTMEAIEGKVYLLMSGF